MQSFTQIWVFITLQSNQLRVTMIYLSYGIVVIIRNTVTMHGSFQPLEYSIWWSTVKHIKITKHCEQNINYLLHYSRLSSHWHCSSCIFMRIKKAMLPCIIWSPSNKVFLWFQIQFYWPWTQAESTSGYNMTV